MKNLKLAILSIPLFMSANQTQTGLSDSQMNEVRAIIQQTQQLVDEQQGNSMGENIFNTQNPANANDYANTNIKIDPLGIGSKRVNNELQDNGAKAYKNKELEIDNMEQREELSKEELELMRRAIRNQNLNALQNRFFAKKYRGYENTQTIKYTPNKTHKIRTRHAMATTLIFDSPIDSYVLGDTSGFSVQELENKPNAIVVKPHLIGIDTSLTIFTNDGKLHTFYIFSTDYKNTNDPNFIIYIKDDEAIKAKQEKQKAIDEKYLTIKDGIAELKILKSDIYSGYVQKAKKENEWLLSAEIFSDKKFTYFKYAKDEMPQIPTIFAVIDKQDSPVETRVIGDYIIAETINPKFTIKSGDSYVCVERKETIQERERKEERKRLNTNKQVLKERAKEAKRGK
ncbi:TrbG/VirB9 family P-type conjugative transfer protein [Campylobacter sp. faydin G-140]|uniref:TrbG/VirB9 family P-type conjugative transfer protein n=1 Tax=Campylobacter anatolicus TaxID=2829105 RepID=UPI001B973BCE|nr:TrbG/VirB9 family P-type conjugative transfer protein [Campylobacter anatolicus]MBR8466529.1 TrbG/VirB9 family P-type conjugative transfer protein [Campylobacter anatolicus]